MGRLNTMTNVGTSQQVISGTTYDPGNRLLTLSGLVAETRSYNALGQLTQLGGLTYAYSSTQNNGKITSQTNTYSGEQVVYAYDALNRLASAAATNNSWGQSYAYDGFGNLTDQNVTAGTAPSLHVTYNAATNRQTGDCADANGNINAASVCGSSGYGYDVENRIVSVPTALYNYAPGNKRVWRGAMSGSTITLDEITFWSIAGQKLATYNLSQAAINGATVLFENLAIANSYFGGRLISNGSGYVSPDRLGSIGSFYPWGQEKPSATQNGTEKFTGYFRDSETGLDYAENRYHQPGMGRFLTVDPYRALSTGPADPSNPGTWNRYAYVVGDPVNSRDPRGLDNCGVAFNRAGPDDGIRSGPSAAEDPSEEEGGCAGEGGIDPEVSDDGSYSVSVTATVDPIPENPSSGDGSLEDPYTFYADAFAARDLVNLTTILTGFGLILPPGWQGGFPNLGAIVGRFNPPAQDPGTVNNFFGTRWCGPGGGGRPVNKLDTACQAHDVCYDDNDLSVGSNFNPFQGPRRIRALWRCNQDLCDAAGNTRDTGSGAVRWYFSRVPIGACSAFSPGKN